MKKLIGRRSLKTPSMRHKLLEVSTTPEQPVKAVTEPKNKEIEEVIPEVKVEEKPSKKTSKKTPIVTEENKTEK